LIFVIKGAVISAIIQIYPDFRHVFQSLIIFSIAFIQGNAIAYNNRTIAYGNKGDFDKTIADCTQGILLNPNNKVLYSLRAAAHGSKGDYDQAIDDAAHPVRTTRHTEVIDCVLK